MHCSSMTVQLVSSIRKFKLLHDWSSNASNGFTYLDGVIRRVDQSTKQQVCYLTSTFDFRVVKQDSVDKERLENWQSD